MLSPEVFVRAELVLTIYLWLVAADDNSAVYTVLHVAGFESKNAPLVLKLSLDANLALNLTMSCDILVTISLFNLPAMIM